jgi:hypothetical protein
MRRLGRVWDEEIELEGRTGRPRPVYYSEPIGEPYLALVPMSRKGKFITRGSR